MDFSDIAHRIEELAEVVRSGRAYKPLIRTKLGSTVGGMTGGVQKRMREMLGSGLQVDDEVTQLILNKWNKVDAGDRVLTTGIDGYDISLSTPVSPDLWYLIIGESVLPFQGDNWQVDSTTILTALSNFLTALDNIKPLKSLRSYNDLRSYFSQYEMRQVWYSDASPSVIRTCRFETWMTGKTMGFVSAGPSLPSGTERTPENAVGEKYRGLLSFPVGPLGVMEVLSIFSESMPQMIQNNVPFSTGSDIIESNVGWKNVTTEVLDGLLSPPTDMTSKCPGLHLVDKVYLISNSDVEYPAKPMEGQTPILPMQSLRYYLRKDAKWPIPGEFVALLAKPWPSHVWWYQQSSPILYAGNWVETNHYTTGIVTAILNPLPGFVGKNYKCRVRGIELCIATTDFFEYAVGARVAIIRIGDLDRSADTSKGNFKWAEMEDVIVTAKKLEEDRLKLSPTPPYVLHPNLMIVPVSFYKP